MTGFVLAVLLRFADGPRLFRRRLRFRLGDGRFSSVLLGAVDSVAVLSVVLFSDLFSGRLVCVGSGLLSGVLAGLFFADWVGSERGWLVSLLMFFAVVLAPVADEAVLSRFSVLRVFRLSRLPRLPRLLRLLRVVWLLRLLGSVTLRRSSLADSTMFPRFSSVTVVSGVLRLGDGVRLA